MIEGFSSPSYAQFGSERLQLLSSQSQSDGEARAISWRDAFNVREISTHVLRQYRYSLDRQTFAQSGHLVQICNTSLEGSHIGTLTRSALAALHEQDRFARVPSPQPNVHAHAEAEPSDGVDSETHVERDFTSIPDLRSMLNNCSQTPIRMEDFGNAMIEQHEEGVIHSEEGVSHTATRVLHSGDGLTQSPERVPAFTDIVTHSEERGLHVDEQHLQTTHTLHEEVPISAITQFEEGGGSEADINLLRRVPHRLQNPHVVRRGFQPLPRQSHIVKRGDHMPMSNIFGLHMPRTRRSQYLPLQSEEGVEHEGGSMNAPSVSAVEVVKSRTNDNSASIILAGSGPSFEEAIEHAASCHPSISQDYEIGAKLCFLLEEYKLVSDTLYLIVSYIDRFLSHHAFLPSLVATLAIVLSRFTVEPKIRPWNLTLKNYLGYRPSELKECVLAIHDLQLSSTCSISSSVLQLCHLPHKSLELVEYQWKALMAYMLDSCYVTTYFHTTTTNQFNYDLKYGGWTCSHLKSHVQHATSIEIAFSPCDFTRMSAQIFAQMSGGVPVVKMTSAVVEYTVELTTGAAIVASRTSLPPAQLMVYSLISTAIVIAISITPYQTYLFIEKLRDIIMRYTVVDLYSTMGCHWVSDGDEFKYPLNPNLRYSHHTVNTMTAECEFRITRASVLVELCRELHIQFSRRLAMRMPIDTP
ncbi:hypothetical protein TEA_028678 [Camellia sinensis var. sinensis]|uniref:Cyclin-like domain-containing protein n=1 Tax=Camellia sinensis var. sinensis TaxID=542762 RepID=A0A4S4DJ89_CAMSN|nr:hypothetical protein TEA_028678 [Camellia sinensis var. sinensis]